jgi:Trypsin
MANIANSGSRLRRSVFTLLAALMLGGGSNDTALAQPSLTAREQEEALIRQELERIITVDPGEAANARKALVALNQPETSAQGRQARNRRERGARRIVNGLPTIGYPAIGAMLKGNDPRSATAWCTGTLVGCDKFLTAAHCVARNPSEKSYIVFFPELGFFEIKRIDWPSREYRFPYFDLAMLTLARPVVGIAPIGINRNTEPLNKSMGTIIGFGRTGGNRTDYGIKREGSIETMTCPRRYASDHLLCWQFDADVKAHTSPSNTCNGDSGGGLLMVDTEDGRNVHKVFGVVSGGKDGDCIKDDLSYNVDVHFDQFRDWIEQMGEGRLSSRMCGRPLWPSKDQQPRTQIVDLGANNPSQLVRIDVRTNTSALRIAMNGEDDGKSKNNFDLLVYRGKEPAEASLVCSEIGPGQFAFCEVKDPEAGTWTAALMREKGEGKVQITIGKTLLTR